MPHFDGWYSVMTLPKPASQQQPAGAPGPNESLYLMADDKDVIRVDSAGVSPPPARALWQVIAIVGYQTASPYTDYGLVLKNKKNERFLRYDEKNPDGGAVSFGDKAEDSVGWFIGKPYDQRVGSHYFPIFPRLPFLQNDTHFNLTVANGGQWTPGSPVITWRWEGVVNQVWAFREWSV